MERTRPGAARHRGGWWVVQQHDQVELREGAERPSTQVQPGERMKRVYGPYESRDAAQKRKDDLDDHALVNLVGR